MSPVSLINPASRRGNPRKSKKGWFLFSQLLVLSFFQHREPNSLIRSAFSRNKWTRLGVMTRGLNPHPPSLRRVSHPSEQRMASLEKELPSLDSVDKEESHFLRLGIDLDCHRNKGCSFICLLPYVRSVHRIQSFGSGSCAYAPFDFDTFFPDELLLLIHAFYVT